MYNIQTLKNGLTLITIPMPHLDSVTTLVAVGAGSRYETKNINGISHFLEHMFFKGSRKFPTAEQISTLIDGLGAVNNAATSKEWTYYWIKSASKHIELANIVLVLAGKLPKDPKAFAEKYYLDLPKRDQYKFKEFKKTKQTKPKVNVFYKATDQANLILGVEGYHRNHPKRYAARILGAILGESMSSRLFIQVRERRGLAYHISAGHEGFVDTGTFTVFAGLKLEKVYEGLEVIKAELERTILEKVTEDELKKAKEMLRGRLAIREESTNFLAEHFGVEYVLDRELEWFDEYLKKIDKVTAERVRDVAKELFKNERYNLQVIAPIKSTSL